MFRTEESKHTVTEDVFSKLPEDQQYYELNIVTLNDVMIKLKINAADKSNSCIIFDDMSAFLKNNETMKMFKELIFNRRHLACSVFFLVQTFKSVPRELRKSFTNMFIFRVGKSELNDIFNEAIELDKELLVPISNLVFDKPFQFLFVNLDSKRLFKNFDETIIEETT